MTDPTPDNVRPIRPHLPARMSPPDRPGTALEGPVYQGELVEEDEVLFDPVRPDGVVPVDQSGEAAPWVPPWETGDGRRPVVAPWLASREQRRHAARWAARRARHTAAFHTVRLPLYAARSVDPRSVARALGRTARWATDPDTAARAAAVPKSDTKEYLQLRERLAKARQVRAGTLGAGAAGFAGTEAVLAYAGPGWGPWLVGLTAAGVLGVAGRRRDRPLLDAAVVVQAEAPRLTSDSVMQALGSLSIAKIDQALTGRGSITFPAPIARDGPGWRAEVDLPLGVTAGEVMGKKDRLASGLRRPVGAVWPEADHSQHGGRLVLWVGDQDMARTKQPPWPLLRSGTADLFAPFPFATDQRGRVVLLTLFETNVLIGALPGAGKTASVREITLAAGLDPTAEVWVFELAGKGDLAAAEKFAARYGSGLDDETIESALWALRNLRAEIARRAEVMKRLPRGICPEGKVTRQAASRRELRLHPLVGIFDEVQNLFAHPTYGKEAGTLAEEIIRMGRALGVILVLATQRPNKDAIPTGVSSLAGVRFCLRVMDQLSNDMILGTSMYQNGIRASLLRPTDKGIGYLVGASDEPQIVRAFYLDLRAADAVAARARHLREAAGWLAGYAAGEAAPDRGNDLSIVRDLIDLFGPLEEKAHSADLCMRLAEAYPNRYGGWEPLVLAQALKAVGVKTKQVWCADPDGESRNGRGVLRDDLRAVL